MFQAASRSRICGSLRYHISGSNKQTSRKTPRIVNTLYLLSTDVCNKAPPPPFFLEAKSPVAFAGLKSTMYLRMFLNSISKVWDSRCVLPHPTIVHVFPRSSFWSTIRWLVTEEMRA